MAALFSTRFNNIQIPPDLKIQFTFRGDCHSLNGTMNDSSEGAIVDIGVSWIIFCYSDAAPQSAVLEAGSELNISFISPRRTVSVNSSIVRRRKVKNRYYFGCRFLDMEPEDARFLFEYLYGKLFTGKEIKELFENISF